MYNSNISSDEVMEEDKDKNYITSDSKLIFNT